MTLFVLSISSGGIRGSYSAKILELLEEFCLTNYNKCIYDIFNVYTGSSTGALIISCIAYDKLKCKYISDNLYNKQMADKMMNTTTFRKYIGKYILPKYDGQSKREVIQFMCSNKKIHDTNKHVVIPLYDISNQKPFIVKSWKYSELNLVDILDATTAAPSYYPPVLFEPIKNKFGVDGALVTSDPALLAYIETLKLFPDEPDIRILSIGTCFKPLSGISNIPNTTKWGGLEWLFKGDIVDTILDNPIRTDEMYLENLVNIKNHCYIKIDSPCENMTMDDTSESNIQTLKSLAQTTWDNIDKNVLRKFLKH